jgi:hypothetical protein
LVLARKDDAVRAANYFGIGGYEDFGAYVCIAGGARQRLLRRAQIAGAVIDNGDTLSHIAWSGTGACHVKACARFIRGASA